jgi:CBS domain-containing protein
MSLEEICRRRVFTVAPKASAEEAARRMARKHVGALIVIDGKRRPVGIVTDRDLTMLVLARGRPGKTTLVEQVMTREPATIHVEAGIADATALMREHGVRRLPVVDARGVLFGIVSFDDILSLLGEELSSLAIALGHELFREKRERRDERGDAA